MCSSRTRASAGSDRDVGDEVNRLVERASPHLTSEECRQLQKAMAARKHLFAKGKGDLGRTDIDQHRIHTGIGADPTKCHQVRDWPVPRDLHEVRSFVGLCSYYRRHIQGFTELAAPLYELATKETEFDWTDRRHEAFGQLKSSPRDGSRSLTLTTSRFSTDRAGSMGTRMLSPDTRAGSVRGTARPQSKRCGQ